MNPRFRFVLMEGTPGAAGGGAAGAAAAAGAGDQAAGAAAGQQGAAAGAGTASAPAGAEAQGNGPTALGSAAGAEWSYDAIPEKFRTLGEDGQPDLQATLRKVDEHRSNLEKRLGSGDIRPKSADEYKLPDNDTFKTLQLDDALAKGFREKAHGWGLSQSQYEHVMNEWASMAPQLVNAGQAESMDTTLQALRGVWKDKAEFDSNMQGAYRAAGVVAQKAGVSAEELESALGNNPMAIRILAALAPEMMEDRTPPAANGGTNGGAMTHAQFLATNWEAFSDPRNPQHAAITAQANRLAEREAARGG